MRARWPYLVVLLLSGFGLARVGLELQAAQVGAKLGDRVDLAPSNLVAGIRPLFGPDHATYKIVEFMDYECGPCRATWPMLKHLVADSRFSLTIRNFPLRTIHPLAERSALVALSPVSIGERRALHNALLESPLSGERLSRLERQVTPGRVMKSREALREDETLAAKAGISHTPTIFVIYNGDVFEVRDLATLSAL